MEEDFEVMRRTRIRARGRVQGVGFRASARAEGRALGVTVDARNLDDGSVVIEAEGPDDAVEEFLAWARVGPPAARVDNVEVEELADE
ncbi:MAG TPA: acylphosphatase [Thermomicrobiales bacterium]|nr:acylphosphatase [Thermomicrobiales bacterium]